MQTQPVPFWSAIKNKISCLPSKSDKDKSETQKLIATEHLGNDASAFGQQTISTFGSYMLNINNIVGPAVVTLPLLLQKEETSTRLMLTNFQPSWMVDPFVAADSDAGSLFIFSNDDGRSYAAHSRFEFGTTMEHFFGRPGFVVGQIIFNICLQANNIASIVVSAQVLDDFLVFTFGHSYAFKFSRPVGFIVSHGSYDADNPFDGQVWIISLGYIIAMMICIPFGFFNLDQNMYFQWFSFFGMMLAFLELFVLFFCIGSGSFHEDHPHPPIIAPPPISIIPHPPTTNTSALTWDTSRVPLFGGALSGQANVIGTIIFMSAFVTTVPSWVNEKMPHVNVNKSIWSSTITSNLLKLLFGYLAAISYANHSKSDNILNIISRHAPRGAFGVITRISVYLFNFATIIPGIPVFSILVRYNLVTGKLCPAWVANLIGVVAPWVVSMFFYHGKGLSVIVNWSAILVQGFVNFAIPGILFYKALQWYPDFPDVILQHENDHARLFQNGNAINEDPNDKIPSGDTKEETPKDPNANQTGSETDEATESVALIVEPTPGWLFANVGRKLNPTNAVPKWFPIPPKALGLGMAVLMTCLTLVALSLDFYFLAKHEDIVDS